MNNNIPSISSLHKEKFIKETSKIDIYNIVINKCVEKIVYTNRHTDKTYIIFEIPKILIGYPNYDMKSCILFVINKLSQSGYMIEFIEPFYLYVDWGSPVNKTQNNLNIKINSLKTNNVEKLRAQTKALLTQFPNTSNVEFVYEDTLVNTSKKNKKNKNKKKK
jgi:hypothetical protein